MAGSWTAQDKIIPGAYINIKTNAPLSVTPGERGVVLLLQELSAGGEAGNVYHITAVDQSEWPVEATAADKRLATEALKCCREVIVYQLPESHDNDDVEDALAQFETVDFNAICYPYDTASLSSAKGTIKTWVESQRSEEGKKVQAVIANFDADSEAIINVVQDITLSDGTVLTAAQVTAWVAGATAGATLTESNTGKKYDGAVDVSPRMTKTQLETALSAGKFVFKVDSVQNVSAVYDINSLTTFTVAKSEVFRKNRVIRELDSIDQDITEIFESGYVGKVDNNEEGRNLLKGTLCEYFNTLQEMGAVTEFAPEDVTVEPGEHTDSVVVTAAIHVVDSVEKIYITVNLS